MVLARPKLGVVLLAGAALVLGLMTPARAATVSSVAPYGANDWSCRPSPARPYPVVLVHGTYGDQKSLFERLSTALVAAGYCVFALDYGNHGTNAVAQSAGELRTFVDKVLVASGAAKVSVVGHSQGGMMPRYYVKYLGGAAKVDDLVGITPSNHGTTWRGLLTLVPNFFCRACFDQMAGSAFLTQLNAGDETPGTVSYTTVVSTSDRILAPTTSGFLSGPNTTNVVLQALCPADTADHLQAPQDPVAIRVVLNALGTPGPASAAFRPQCAG